MLSLTRCSLLLAVCAPLWSQTQGVPFQSLNALPVKEFGHSRLVVGAVLGLSPNLLEGREFYSPSAVAVDTSSSPPILYVADANNHRVLAWQNPAGTSVGDAATKVIGQRDVFSGFPGGPGTQVLTAAGLTLPSALAVDSNGNLYVLDAGNNRIMRFPKPLAQTGDLVQPDLVIGQKTPAAGNTANQGQPKPNEKTLSLRSGNTAGGGMAFDLEGNLWVADTFNNRVLRFPKSRLTGSEPAADVVLGQALFTTNDATPFTSDHRVDLDSMIRPTALAIDSRGGVYISDGLYRVLYYASPATGGLASRVLGIQAAPPQGQPVPTAPSQHTLGYVTTPQGSQLQGPPQCLFTAGTIVFVCDTVAHRILRYNAPEQWPAATPTAPSPAAAAVFGQNSFNEGIGNRGQGQFKPNGDSLNTPVAAVVLENTVWVVDTGNNRVLSMPLDPASLTIGNATRVLGQKAFDTYAPNLVEGREMFVYSSAAAHGTAIAIDRASTPNRLYVADSLNNRILAFSDVRKVGTDQWGVQSAEPDFVIGQPDKIRTGPNYPSYDALIPSDQGLRIPSGVAVDKDGNLWVADTGNGRVLRFPSPFNQPAGTVQRANLVLGQATFSFTVPDASSSTMAAPISVAILNNGDVAAADLNHHRVLLFRKTGSDFGNGQPARAVLGQQNFFTTAPGASSANLRSPRGMTVDTSDRLYVADSGNNRVVVYTDPPNIVSGAAGIAISGLSTPESVAVSPATGDIWIASAGNNTVSRYAEYSKLGTAPTYLEQYPVPLPLAIALDAKDNLLVVDASNRMTFYYGYIIYRNAANYTLSRNVRNAQNLDSNSKSLTPGMYTIIARSPNIQPFAFTPAVSGLPFPKQFGGVEVRVNNIPAPIWRLDGASMVFLVPNNAAATSNDAEIVVRDTASGEILGAGTFALDLAAPGFFTANLGGTGQISATNADGTPNSPANRAAMDSTITIWMNGSGYIPNIEDGVPPNAAIWTQERPFIFVGAYRVPPENITYSGVSPEFPGLWQINFKLPKVGDLNAPVPGEKIPIVVTMRDIPSNVIGRDGGTNRIEDRFVPINDAAITTIAIKQ